MILTQMLRSLPEPRELLLKLQQSLPPYKNKHTCRYRILIERKLISISIHRRGLKLITLVYYTSMPVHQSFLSHCMPLPVNPTNQNEH